MLLGGVAAGLAGAWALESYVEIKLYCRAVDSYLHSPLIKFMGSHVMWDATVKAFYCSNDPYLHAYPARHSEWRVFTPNESFDDHRELPSCPRPLPQWVCGRTWAESWAAARVRTVLGVSAAEVPDADSVTNLHNRLFKLTSHRLINEYLNDCISYEIGHDEATKTLLASKYRDGRVAVGQPLSLTPNLVHDANYTDRRHGHVVKAYDGRALIVDGTEL